MTSEKYSVRWRGPFTWEEVREEKGYHEKEELYAIAHEPPTREPKTLYVGMTYWHYIGNRLAIGHHADAAIEDEYGYTSIVYYLGLIKLDPDQIRSEHRTKDVEAAIINKHGDYLEFNKQSTNTYYGRDLKISHIGSAPPGLENFDTSRWE